jgi:O-antigen ligase
MALGHAHNYYLNLLAETGIVGLLGYLIAWIWIFVISMGHLATSQGLFVRGRLRSGNLGLYRGSQPSSTSSI